MSSDGSYQGIVAESYDIWFSGDKFDDTDFYKKFIKELPGSVLEIACGLNDDQSFMIFRAEKN